MNLILLTALMCAPQDVERPTVDVVFVLDTTGSMGGLIDGAKRKIWSIAERIGAHFVQLPGGPDTAAGESYIAFLERVVQKLEQGS